MTTTDPATVPVMLVDDHEIWRDGVRAMFKGTEFYVTSEASSAHEVAQALASGRPQMVLLDIRMKDGDGFEALEILRQIDSQVTVLMLTTYENPTFMARAVARGASGYLLKGLDREQFLEALRRSVKGETLLSGRDLVELLRGIGEGAAHSPDLFESLTPREVEVLELISTGLPNKEIGSVLGISEGTVKSHVEHITGKLGVSDRLRAAVWATQFGPIAHP